MSRRYIIHRLSKTKGETNKEIKGIKYKRVIRSLIRRKENITA